MNETNLLMIPPWMIRVKNMLSQHHFYELP